MNDHFLLIDAILTETGVWDMGDAWPLHKGTSKRIEEGWATDGQHFVGQRFEQYY